MVAVSKNFEGGKESYKMMAIAGNYLLRMRAGRVDHEDGEGFIVFFFRVSSLVFLEFL